ADAPRIRSSPGTVQVSDRKVVRAGPVTALPDCVSVMSRSYRYVQLPADAPARTVRPVPSATRPCHVPLSEAVPPGLVLLPPEPPLEPEPDPEDDPDPAPDPPPPAATATATPPAATAPPTRASLGIPPAWLAVEVAGACGADGAVPMLDITTPCGSNPGMPP